MKASRAMTSRSSSAPAASNRRSSSSSRDRMTISTKAWGSSRRAGGAKAWAHFAASLRAALSRAARASTPGLRTLTATLRPSSSTASCAWAREAAATASPKLENRLSMGRPSDRSTSARATAVGKGLRASRRWARSSTNWLPKISDRVARNCPSLMATGPWDSSTRASRSPGRPLREAPPAGRRMKKAATFADGGRTASISRGSRASARIRAQPVPINRPRAARLAMG